MRLRTIGFVCLLAALPVVAQAQERGESAAHAETIHGVVERVDYASGTISVANARGRKFTILTSPSTTFIGSKSSGYEELSDIRPGAHLTVEASNAGNRFDASLIKIHDAR